MATCDAGSVKMGSFCRFSFECLDHGYCLNKLNQINLCDRYIDCYTNQNLCQVNELGECRPKKICTQGAQGEDQCFEPECLSHDHCLTQQCVNYRCVAKENITMYHCETYYRSRDVQFSCGKNYKETCSKDDECFNNECKKYQCSSIEANDNDEFLFFFTVSLFSLMLIIFLWNMIKNFYVAVRYID